MAVYSENPLPLCASVPVLLAFKLRVFDRRSTEAHRDLAEQSFRKFSSCFSNMRKGRRSFLKFEKHRHRVVVVFSDRYRVVVVDDRAVLFQRQADIFRHQEHAPVRFPVVKAQLRGWSFLMVAQARSRFFWRSYSS